ncbi:MAG: hypothetical protein OEW87_07725 [Flavobacteriaceae bacterium]|nr:hypothetical protein [Flavobacteriaceae bacterium]
MNKFITYGILLLIYLGLSKSLSPNEFGIKYIQNEQALAELISGSTISVVLTDIHSTGFIIKTFYHKYKIIYGFQSYEELIIRTSRGFTNQLKPYLGMSVFRRYREDNKESFTPLPPGSIFIGDKSFGNWQSKGPNKKVWRFFRVYRQIPTFLGWKSYIPSLKEYNEITKHEKSKKPYHGSNHEFGIKGVITQTSFPKYFERKKPDHINFKSFFKNLFKENFIK